MTRWWPKARSRLTYFRKAKGYKGTDLAVSQWDHYKRWKGKSREKMLYQKHFFVFHFGMKRHFYIFGAETARDWSPPQNIRDQVAVAHYGSAEEMNSSHSHSLSCAFHVPGNCSNHRPPHLPWSGSRLYVQFHSH